MTSPTMKKICSAIESKSVIEFDYEGMGKREVEPHTCGVSTAGNEVIRGFQTYGFSKSNKQPPWKLFDIEKISNLTVLDKKFARARPGYSQGDSAFDQIFAEL